MAYFSLENAKSTPWSAIVESVCSNASMDRPIHVVSPAEWFEKLSTNVDSPAYPVLDYLEEYILSSSRRSLPVLSTAKARTVVEDLIDYDIYEDLIKLYVAYACD
jgi:hypothetical protein